MPEREMPALRALDGVPVMPDFLKRLLLLAAVNWVGIEMISRNMHNFKALLITLAVMIVANPAIWKWEFE